MKENDNGVNFWMALSVSLLNLGLFSFLFILMGYFELVGSDPAYYDEGTKQTIKLLNYPLDLIGLGIDPNGIHQVTTLHWAVALGVSLVSTCFAIMLANRAPMNHYETTMAKR